MTRLGIWLAATCLLSCGFQSRDTPGAGEGGVLVRVHLLDEASVDRVVVHFDKVSNHAVDRIHTILRQTDGTFNELLEGVEVGEYDVSAEAFHGVQRAFWSTPIRYEVLPNQPKVLDLFLFQEEEDTVEGPFITAIAFQSPPVVSEPVEIRVWGGGGAGALELSGTGSGSFDNGAVQGSPTDPGGAGLMWTPVGPDPGEQEITLVLRDETGSEYRMTLAVFVNPQRGDVQFSIVFNHAPEAPLVLEILQEGAVAEATIDASYRDPDAAAWQGAEYWLEAEWNLSDCTTKGWALISDPAELSERVDVKGGPVQRSLLLKKTDVAEASTCRATLELNDDNPSRSPSARTIHLDLRVEDVAPSIPCPEDWEDCDGDPSNGCEADLGGDANCGACGNVCGMDQICSGSVCTCSVPGFTQCDGICVDTQVDPDHCGTCGNSCIVGCDAGACIPVDVGFLPPRQGSRHACVVSTDGDVYCWGDNETLGVGDASLGHPVLRPALVSLPGPAAEVTPALRYATAGTGHIFTCAHLENNGEVYCWGSNQHRQIATGSLDVNYAPRRIVMSAGINPPLLEGVKQLAATMTTVCAILEDEGRVQCWGSNSKGQRGINSTTTPNPATYPGDARDPDAPTDANKAFKDVAQIAAGSEHFCAVTSAGDLYCWGSNGNGRTGLGTSTGNTLVPSKVSLTIGGTDYTAVQVAAAEEFSCALLGDGQIACWGRNNYHQFGSSTPTSSTTPVLVPGVADARGIVVGTGHVCAWFDGGTAKCWGNNSHGQIGLGVSDSTRYPPSEVLLDGAPMIGVSSMSAYANSTCALRDGTELLCWGQNVYGELGTNDTEHRKLEPTPPAW